MSKDASFIFILPGLNNSGSEHWQTYWEKKYGLIRINQDEWDSPVRENWISRIDSVVTQYPPDKVIFVAHSLACCTTVFWAKEYGRNIKGALLVGPSDTEAPRYPPGTTGFKPMPLFRLPFPSIVIASMDDEFVSLARATQFANAWGSELINVGPLGHINSLSNIGAWEEGYQYLKRLDSPSASSRE